MYARISRDRTGAHLGVTRQLEDLCNLHERLGYGLGGVYVDNDISASNKRKKRKDYLALLEALKTTKVRFVTTWHTDRLHRQPIELEEYIEACEKNETSTVSVLAGHLDLSTPAGRYMARQFGAAARYEVELTRERLKREALQRVEKGIPFLGGSRRWGWLQDGVTPHPEEFPALVQVGKRLIAGESMRSLAEDLTRRGFLTPRGNPWIGATLGKMLKNPALAGKMVHQGEVVGNGIWEPAFDEQTWGAICQIMNDNAKYKSKTPNRVWLGSGLYRCGLHNDGTRMTSGKDNKQVSRYVCRESRHLSRKAVPVDELVERTIVQYLSDPENFPRLKRNDTCDTGALYEEIGIIRQQINHLDDEVDDGIITKERWLRRNQRLTARVKELEDKISIATAKINPTLEAIIGNPDLSRIWFGSREDHADGLPLDRRTAIVDAVATVTILPTDKVGRPKNGWRLNPKTILIKPHAV